MADITRLMQRGLDGSWLRHEVLAATLLTVKHPDIRKGFELRPLSQECTGPRTVLSTTSPLHLEKASHDIPLVTQDTSSVTPDGNSVDIDREMAEVSCKRCTIHHSQDNWLHTSHF